MTRRWNVDAFSTGPLFAGWQEREGEPLLWRWRSTYEPLIVYGAIPFGYVPSQPNGGVAAATARRAGVRAT